MTTTLLRLMGVSGVELKLDGLVQELLLSVQSILSVEMELLMALRDVTMETTFGMMDVQLNVRLRQDLHVQEQPLGKNQHVLKSVEMDLTWENCHVMTLMLSTLMVVLRHVMLKLDLNAEEELSNQETGVLKSGMMVSIMDSTSAIREISIMRMVVTSSEELNLVGLVMMEDLGLLMFVGIGVEMEEDYLLKNVMITI